MMTPIIIDAPENSPKCLFNIIFSVGDIAVNDSDCTKVTIGTCRNSVSEA